MSTLPVARIRRGEIASDSTGKRRMSRNQNPPRRISTYRQIPAPVKRNPRRWLRIMLRSRRDAGGWHILLRPGTLLQTPPARRLHLRRYLQHSLHPHSWMRCASDPHYHPCWSHKTSSSSLARIDVFPPGWNLRFGAGSFWNRLETGFGRSKGCVSSTQRVAAAFSAAFIRR